MTATIGTETWAAVLALSLLSVVSVAVGIGLAFLLGDRPRLIAGGIGLSVAIMLLISIGELLPEALRQGDPSTVVVASLAGAGLIAVLHVVIPHTHLVDESTGLRARWLTAGYLVGLGLVLHDFPEGVALANSYVLSTRLGVLTALAIALHNVPEEFAMAVPVVAAGKFRFLAGIAVLSAVAEPAGAVVGLGLAGFGETVQVTLLAFAAGAMIFVSLHELVPLAGRLGHRGSFGLGAAVGGLVYAGLSLVSGGT